MAAILAAAHGAKVTILEAGEEGRSAFSSAGELAAFLRDAKLEVDVKRADGKALVDAVVAESANHDLLVLGAGERWALSRTAFGPTEDDIAAKARCPVVMFRKGIRAASGG